jgi:adenylate kinase
MRVILLGPPGVGKGTQAIEISKKYNIPHISTGDIFRESIKHETELGKEVKTYLDRGKLVPDDLTIQIVRSRLQEPDCQNGFLLDGFPRTVFQAEAFSKILKEQGQALDAIVKLDADKDVIAKRTAGRRVCRECKATYNIVTKPTKRPGVCDICGAEVYQRADDDEATVAKRIEVYLKQTQPLVDYYEHTGRLLHIDGEQEMEAVTEAIMQGLSAAPSMGRED